MESARKIGFGLVTGGVAVLALDLLLGGRVNLWLPLIFFMLSGAFFALNRALGAYYRWAAILYIPAALFAAMGMVMLLSVLTEDWNAWAYGWMLVVAALGGGAAFAARDLSLPRIVSVIAFWTVVSGLTGFGVFGAIAGGEAIRYAVPLLLALVGAGVLSPHVRDLTRSILVLGSAAPALPRSEAPRFTGPSVSLAEPVSAREREVLRLMAAGLSNAEIAERLTVAPSTVKTHVNNIFGKLGVQTRVQAINKAREYQLID